MTRGLEKAKAKLQAQTSSDPMEARWGMVTCP
jgi:hypothetical protein